VFSAASSRRISSLRVLVNSLAAKGSFSSA